MANNQSIDAGAKGRIYDQWCEDFRALQLVFWRVPFFAMTITGGLGAAVIAFDGAIEIKRLLLGFAGICDFVLILIAWRIRKTMERILIKIYEYEGVKKQDSKFFVLKCFTLLFGILGVGSLLSAALFPSDWLSAKETDTRENDSATVVSEVHNAVPFQSKPCEIKQCPTRP